MYWQSFRLILYSWTILFIKELAENTTFSNMPHKRTVGIHCIHHITYTTSPTPHYPHYITYTTIPTPHIPTPSSLVFTILPTPYSLHQISYTTCFQHITYITLHTPHSIHHNTYTTLHTPLSLHHITYITLFSPHYHTIIGICWFSWRHTS